MASGSQLLADNWWLWGAALATFVLAITMSLVLTVWHLRPSGLAKRTGVVVLVLSIAVALATVTTGAPPILPMLLGVVFSFNVSRAAAKRRRG